MIRQSHYLTIGTMRSTDTYNIKFNGFTVKPIISPAIKYITMSTNIIGPSHHLKKQVLLAASTTFMFGYDHPPD